MTKKEITKKEILINLTKIKGLLEGQFPFNDINPWHDKEHRAMDLIVEMIERLQRHRVKYLQPKE